MEDKVTWIEYSLKRTSALGLEVLQRAKRREVNCSPACRPGHETRWEHPESMEQAEDDGASLEEAFSAMANFMRYTTEQCAKYHNCIPASDADEQETRHTCRFHRRKPQQRPPAPASNRRPAACPPQSIGVQRRPQDVSIEVSPGTYRISAGSRRSARQTHVVNIPPGQTVGLTFDF